MLNGLSKVKRMRRMRRPTKCSYIVRIYRRIQILQPIVTPTFLITWYSPIVSSVHRF